MYTDYGWINTKQIKHRLVKNFDMPFANVGFFDEVAQSGFVVAGCLIKLNEGYFFKCGKSSNTKAELLVFFTI